VRWRDRLGDVLNHLHVLLHVGAGLFGDASFARASARRPTLWRALVAVYSSVSARFFGEELNRDWGNVGP
jgi:hypothetical protein